MTYPAIVPTAFQTDVVRGCILQGITESELQKLDSYEGISFGVVIYFEMKLMVLVT